MAGKSGGPSVVRQSVGKGMTFVESYGMDRSDVHNKGERPAQADMPMAASGSAGGYPSSMESHTTSKGGRPTSAGPGNKGS